MNTKRNNLKSTLSKKVLLQKDAKDLNTIEKQVTKLHSESKNNDTVLTTIHLPREIHTKVKMHCATNGITFKEFVTETLVKNLITK